MMDRSKKVGLQMAIISQNGYKKCKLCLLFVLACCFGCDTYLKSVDTKILKASSDIEKELKKCSKYDSSKAFLICKNLEKRFPESNYVKVITSIAYSEIYEFWGNKPLSLYYSNVSLKLAQENRYYREEAKVYLQKLKLTNTYEDALKYLQKFEKIQKERSINDSNLLFQFYFEYGYYYREQKDFSSSKNYFIKALNISRKNNLLLEESATLNALSMVFNDQYKYNIALKLIDKALNISLKCCLQESAEHYVQKAITLFEMRRYNEAKLVIEKAKNLYKLYPQYDNPGVLEGILGDLYLQQKKYKEAEINYLTFVKKATYPTTKIWAYNRLSNFYGATKAYQEAWLTLSKFNNFKDSVYSEEKTNLLANETKKFELYQQKEVFKEKELRYQFSLIIAIILVVSIVLLIIVLYHNIYLKSELQKSQQVKLQQEIEFEQRKLALSTLQLSQHNDVLKNLKKDIEKLNSISPELIKEHTRVIVKTLENDLNIDNEWDKFKLHFESVSPHFFEILRARSPQLTDLDLKHCAYLKMNLTPKQVAQILGVAPKSVTLSRVRIKKKLHLLENEQLADFLKKI